jgi:hypothetical protein
MLFPHALTLSELDCEMAAQRKNTESRESAAYYWFSPYSSKSLTPRKPADRRELWGLYGLESSWTGIWRLAGGWGGIRTHDTVPRILP